MRDPAIRRQVLLNLRFALDVMEERSHIGLDDKAAATVRRTLQHRIVEAEKALVPAPSVDRVDSRSPKELLTA